VAERLRDLVRLNQSSSPIWRLAMPISKRVPSGQQYVRFVSQCKLEHLIQHIAASLRDADTSKNRRARQTCCNYQAQRPHGTGFWPRVFGFAWTRITRGTRWTRTAHCFMPIVSTLDFELFSSTSKADADSCPSFGHIAAISRDRCSVARAGESLRCS